MEWYYVCWPWLTTKGVEPVVSISWASCIQGGSTVTLCAIDLSKAFDRVNHYALFSKLMKRFVPNELLIITERWLSNCCSCVKWNVNWSDFFYTWLWGQTGLGPLALPFRATLGQYFQSDILQNRCLYCLIRRWYY